MAHSLKYPKAPVLKPEKAAIACIGDSITYGAGITLTRGTQSYPAYLQKLVGDKYQVQNYGLSGRTLMRSGDQPYSDEEFYQISRDVGAGIYIIMLGTNDSKPYNWCNAGEYGEEYEKELTEFVRSYAELPSSPEIYLMQPPKAFSSKYDIDDDAIQDSIYNIVARVAASEGCGLIDLYSFTQAHPEWFDDGIHPNAKGNQALAEYIAEVLEGQY